MDDVAALIAPAPDDPEGRAEARACAAEARIGRQLAMLQELADIGMQMARAVRDEALARAETADENDAAAAKPSRVGGGDLGLVYSRIARAVRQTLALETRVADGIEAASAEHARRRAETARAAADVRRREVRDYVIEAIETETVAREAPESEVEWLLAELDGRLDYGEYDDALADAPIGDLVARICADLGVTPDWSLWEDQDWAIEYQASRPAHGDIGAERWNYPHLYPTRSGAAEPPDAPPPDSS